MDILFDTPIKAIRKHCIECSNYQLKEVRDCTCIECPLYAYRMGTRPSQDTIDRLKDNYQKNHKLAKEV